MKLKMNHSDFYVRNCEQCEYSTDDAFDFKRHVSEGCKFSDKKILKAYTCDICGRTGTHDTIRMHLNR